MAYVRTVPVLRSFDEVKAREFYVAFLGFEVDFEHRFEPSLPLYMQVSRAGILLHLSEHHGDGSPGANVRVEMTGVRALQAELVAKNYKNARPGLEHPPWGGTECTVTDPAGNRITFCERASTRIARRWTARATTANADRYVALFEDFLSPGLRKLEGFLGASVATRPLGEEVQVEVVTYWSSMDAITGFAGASPNRAVIEPEAAALLSSSDAEVSHATERLRL